MTLDTVTVEGAKCENETEKAILVSTSSGSWWVPKSVVHDDSEVYATGTDGDLVVARWFAEKEGIES